MLAASTAVKGVMKHMSTEMSCCISYSFNFVPPPIVMDILLIGACICYAGDVNEMEVQGVMTPSSVNTVGPPQTIRSEELLFCPD